MVMCRGLFCMLARRYQHWPDIIIVTSRVLHNVKEACGRGMSSSACTESRWMMMDDACKRVDDVDLRCAL